MLEPGKRRSEGGRGKLTGGGKDRSSEGNDWSTGGKLPWVGGSLKSASCGAPVSSPAGKCNSSTSGAEPSEPRASDGSGSDARGTKKKIWPLPTTSKRSWEATPVATTRAPTRSPCRRQRGAPKPGLPKVTGHEFGGYAERLTRHSAYWYSVWSHRRNQLWKGFVQVDLAPGEDTFAASPRA